MSMTDKLLNGLNPQQQKAVQTTNGPLLLMAGAGSGKTRVLTHRIAYLLGEKGVAPWNVLAITFTNKAAREMRERIDTLVGPEAEDIWISTFHSMCVRILRRDIDRIGINRNFTILDSGDQLTVVKKIMKERNIDPKKFEPRSILAGISNAKNELLSADKYAKKITMADPYEKLTSDVYTEYQKRLLKNNSLDFDDLIMTTIQLFERVPEVLEFYQRKFQYIHVDEYQDTNKAQYLLVKHLAARFKNLCVVGDSDQSIYRWRGADISNILSFEKDYENAQVILLEQNYRSSQNILNAANAVIEKIRIVNRRNYGRTIKLGAKFRIIVLQLKRTKHILLRKKFVTIFKWGNENTLILQYYIVRMLSLVWSRRFSLNLTSRTKLSGVRSSTTVKRLKIFWRTYV